MNQFKLIDRIEIETNYHGNEEILADIASRLIQQIDSDVRELKKCFNDGNLEELAILSHRLKGACSNFFAAEVVSKLYQIEQQSKRRIHEGLDSLLLELPELIELFKSDLCVIENYKAA